MSFALTGVIALQVKWISHDIRLKEQQFDQAVNRALIGVVDKLETDEAAHILRSRLFNINPDSITEMMLSDTTEGDLYQVKDTIIETPAEEEVMKTPWPQDMDRGGYNVEFKQPGKQRSYMRVQRRNIIHTDSISKRTIESSQITRIYGDSAEVIIRQNEERIKSRLSKLNEVMKRMALEFVGSDEDVLKRLHGINLDSLIHGELATNRITLPYQFGILSATRSSFLLSGPDQPDSLLFHSPYRITLFPHDVVTRPDMLILRFPDTFPYFLNSLWVMLLTSILFTAVLIVGFSYTIWVILKQKKLSDIKSDFINNMTHEFKTPIATISLAVDSIRNPKTISDPEKFDYFTRIIREENRRMNSQVERVLQMAQLDKEDLELKRESVDMHELINKAIDQIQLQVDSKKGTIKANLLAVQSHVTGDPVHLLNIVFNLLDNANKYSPESPEIKVETHSSMEGLFIRISDRGIGMSREMQSRIFEKFFRVPTGNVHNVKGFGLGLSYVDVMLKKHHGTIRVDSEPGKGSTFEIYLPLKQPIV